MAESQNKYNSFFPINSMVIEATKMGSSLIGCKLDRKRKPSPNLQKIRKQKKTETKIIYLKAMKANTLKR